MENNMQKTIIISDTIKLGKNNNKGITLSFNIKKSDNHANLNKGDLFGFHTTNKGLSVSINCGEIYFQTGG